MQFQVKTLILAVAIYAMASICANAQAYAPQTFTPMSAAIVANTTTNTASDPASIIDVRRNLEMVGLQMECTPSTNFGGSSITMVFRPSVDGVTFASKPVYTWIHAMEGGTNVATQTIATNLNIGGYGYLQLFSVANSNNTNAVSVVLKWAIKKATSP